MPMDYVRECHLCGRHWIQLWRHTRLLFETGQDGMEGLQDLIVINNSTLHAHDHHGKMRYWK